MVYKILVFPLPLVGHSNPAIKVVNELVKTHKAKVIVYSVTSFQKQIEDVNAEYREIDKASFEEMQKGLSTDNFIQVMNVWQHIFFQYMEKFTLKIAHEILNEKPDLVFYDSFNTTTKIALEMLDKNFKNRSNLSKNTDPNILVPSSPLPPAIPYWTTFMNEKDIYPNVIEKNLLLNKLSVIEKLRIVLIVIDFDRRLKNISKKYNGEPISFENFQHRDKTKLNIVFTFPELHPRAHLFDDTIFVGPCISDEVHLTGVYKYENTKTVEVLKQFPVINPPNYSFATANLKTEKDESAKGEKLIYVSLGTLYNENSRVYSLIIDAFKAFDVISSKDENDYSIKLSDLTVIFSVGKDSFEYFEKQINNNLLTLPENIILQSSVPQLEILKRASLFITHSGMNSTSESVHYGVPMICIPFFGDQLGNAYRIATELGLGIELDFKKMRTVDVKLAVKRILSDRRYYERCALYSSISSQYNGQKNSADIIIDYIKKNKNE